MKHILTFCFLLALTPCRAQKVKPALHLAIGKTYYLESKGTSAIVQDINGKENKVDLALAFKMAFKVTGITDTLYHMEVRYQTLEMKIKMADTSFDMTSARTVLPGEKDNKPDTPSAVMAAMMDKPFSVTLSTRGKITSVENLDKIIAGAFDGFPKIDPAKKELVKNQFMQSFGENAFKGSLEMGTAIFPLAPVGINDKWSMNTVLASPAPANVHAVYRLTDLSGDDYRIHGEGTISTDSTAKPIESNGLPMKYELNGSILADIKIDKKTGWISEVHLKQLLEGNIKIMDNPKIPGGMSVPMMFDTEMITTGK